MPRQGNGTYTLPPNTWFPGVNGVTATTSDWNATATDIQAAITQSVSSDGQTPMTGNLPMGNNKITGLAPATADTDGASLANIQAAVGQSGAAVFRNRIRNPNFEVNQRVVSGSVVLAAGAYGHDGWKAGAAGCTYTFTTSGVDTVITITAGSLQQIIEGRYIEGGSYVMSWFGTAQGKIAAGSYAASGVTAASVTAAGNLTVEFNTGTLSRVQLEPGTVPTPFERKGYANELAWCKRYLPVWRSLSTNDQVGAGQATSGTTAIINYTFDVELRASVTSVSAGGSFVVTSATGAALVLTGMTLAVTGRRSVLLSAPVAGGLVAGNGTTMQGTLATSIIVFGGAEL